MEYVNNSRPETTSYDSAPASVQEVLFQLPPDESIRELAIMLEDYGPRTILDVGCGTGRNSHFLAERGHRLFGVSIEFEEVQQAVAQAKALGKIAGRSVYVVGDARKLMFKQATFQIVLANEVLHLMSKTDSRRTLDSIREVTESRGLNVVSGYLVKPREASTRNDLRCFHPGELLKSYEEAGWTILSDHEKYLPIQVVKGKDLIFSRAFVIAQKS